MKKHYFLIGSIIGLVAALGVGYWAMNKSLWAMMFSFEKYNGFVPIFCGSMTILAVAKLCDKKSYERTVLVTWLTFADHHFHERCYRRLSF